ATPRAQGNAARAGARAGSRKWRCGNRSGSSAVIEMLHLRVVADQEQEPALTLAAAVQKAHGLCAPAALLCIAGFHASILALAALRGPSAHVSPLSNKMYSVIPSAVLTNATAILPVRIRTRTFAPAGRSVIGLSARAPKMSGIWVP